MNRFSKRGISSESNTLKDGLPALLTRISSHKHGHRGMKFIKLGWGEEGLGKGMGGDHPVSTKFNFKIQDDALSVLRCL